MAYTDDEAEDLLEFVSNYCFEDDDKSPISFSVLPVIWNTSETTQNIKKQIYIRGTSDDGLQTVYKPVKAWNFDVSGEKPEISVLTKENNWLKLQKPRKAFQDVIRTVLVTVNFLHLMKKNQQLNEKVIWNKLSRTFSSYDVRPSESDLEECKSIIQEAVRRDEQLAQSEYLMTFLGKRPQTRKKLDEDALSKEKRGFIVDDDEIEDGSDAVDDDSSEEEDGDEDPFDSVCCICDNGGSILCCEGSCMRSFHATRSAAAEAESGCTSLGFTEMEVKAIPNFKCKNCQYKLHQCFSCGQLGSSDKSSGAKVFQCVNATCGYFYHPHCVTKLLHRDSEGAANELQNRILAGESFTCPLHICFVCRQQEDKSVPELKMAVCRRCPKAYHEKCLPRKIAFEEDEEQGIFQRAWRELLVDRILIYCLKHKIVEDLGTPERNHIKFPDVEKKRQYPVALKDNFASKKKMASAEAACQTGTVIQSRKKAALDRLYNRRMDQKFLKLKGADDTPTEKKLVSSKVWESCKAEDQQLLPGKPSNSEEMTKIIKSAAKNPVPQLDLDSERRICALIEEASSIITLDDVIDNHSKVVHARTYKHKIEKNKSITHGKVEGSCEAVRAAIKRLNGGGNIEHAKAICDGKVLEQVTKWKCELRVYLAPFLYGMRYTSYGRHFTKVDKLKEIVEKIHWYVNGGDTIVDFCCGANDFSLLMKQKLEETGKTCSFKNYDLFRPKNDFSFETRNWMEVKPSELPNGSELIIGLNPPFGVKAALANQFIDKALLFKPKLLILIVPPETQRLDKKKKPYDLIWEDTEKLSGKSFYLPGSVDVNERQMDDWNVVAPVLYLWSRPDWTTKHKTIAQKYGHLDGKRDKHRNELVPDSSFKRKRKRNSTAIKQKNKDAAAVINVPDRSLQPILSDQLNETASGRTPEDLESQPTHSAHKGEKHDDHKGDKHASETQGNSEDNSNSLRNKGHNEEKHPMRRSVETGPDHMQWQSSPSNVDHRGQHSAYTAHHSPVNSRFSMDEGYSSLHQGAPSNVIEMREPVHEQVDSTNYEASYRRGARDENQVEYYHERVGNYNHLQPNPYSSVTDRYSIDTHHQPHPHPQSSELVSDYPREPERHSFTQLPPSEHELRYGSMYSMESNYGRMNYVPASERYNLRLDEQNQARADNVNLHMPQMPGVGSYNYNYEAPRTRYPSDQMHFRPDPNNPYHPYN